MKVLVTLISFFIFSCTTSSIERPSAGRLKMTVWDKGAMVSAANPHAVDAAVEIIKKGGSAVDAAIAAHAVLGLVEPQSSGLGGGGFMLNYDFASGALTFIDGRETAPSKATIDMFMRNGNVMSFREAWVSGKAVGSPGAVALYKTAHERSGKIPWDELFLYAIDLAENGFKVSARLAGFVKAVQSYGRLSIFVQCFFDVTVIREVDKSSFNPSPKVQSIFLKLIPKVSDMTPNSILMKNLSTLTREAFSKRRKLITNSLKSFFTEEDLVNLGIERKSRPENLSVETYIKLAKSIQSG